MVNKHMHNYQRKYFLIKYQNDSLFNVLDVKRIDRDIITLTLLLSQFFCTKK
jgi:hypothetical protein